MQTLRKIIIPLLALSLSGCTISNKYGFFKDETQSYQKVKQLDGPVAIPQNLAANGVENYYEVPGGSELNGPENGQPPLTPPGSGMQESQGMSQQDKIRHAENAKIQGHTSTSRRSNPVTAKISYNQAWNKIESVLQSANYKVVEKDNALSTYYVVDTHNSGGKIKKDMPIYQVHIKSSGGSTRVTVSPANPGLQNLLARSL